MPSYHRNPKLVMYRFSIEDRTGILSMPSIGDYHQLRPKIPSYHCFASPLDSGVVS
jgi:hypothetical protein